MKKRTLDKKDIIRRCVGCGELKERSHLVKITKTHDTCEVVISPTSRHFGRSSYLCYNKECLKNAIKKRRLQKALKKEISASTLEHLENIIHK
ncbi:MAG: hypothetical protein A2287_02585 [Candidatus Melainabacteria bacterium RIFOXYA12_FULL_32_12]|nr:MAG: hypothetical protein A2104_01450 [Candidatus Melainabacteria bacterium GWF2_32_7]OGI22059.1 MAG: hypothetical protein A2255_07950 [Candidatus Melainabacteria bacterium RIFOXYA2_FULL_32_9]OGI28971.1 MAG: hypothetical protein A2287_02585 [Candidatus Melainabacteria bacterium RIFOXYA12_FULL_32_12]